MGAELREVCWVCFAIDGNVADDVRAVVYTVLDVGGEVRGYILVVMEIIQRDDGKVEETGDFLSDQHKRHIKVIKIK